ncbi:MAG: hypothetical protein NTX07_06555 [Solirubrobacterales bacterium]|nr:hypothetical protein [Solirubrobacterales bacterium]
MFKTKLAMAGAACAVAVLPVASADARATRSSGVVIKVDRGGKGVSVVAAHGRVKRVKLKRKAPRGVRGGSKIVVSGGKVISAKGRAKATRIRAKIVNRRGHKTALTTDGTPLSVIIGGVTTTCAPAPVIGTILALNRTASKVMIQKADGTRGTYIAPVDSLTSLKRGDEVLLADADADGTAEAISALSGTARHLEGEVAWIDAGWGAFGLQKADGTIEVVDASACQLADLSEGDQVATVVHTDADGEVIADAVAVSDQSGDDDYWGSGHNHWPPRWLPRG